MADATMAAVDPQLNSRLAQIPLEVLIRITYFISTGDLVNVRLSCKVLEQGLFNSFSHEFFRKKQFMVTNDSLQALVDISKHPTLSPCLRHVIISAERPAVITYSPGENNKAAARLRLALADHLSLLATGGARDMLAEAFGALANLETVDIRDFNSFSRNRDGTGAPWTSYGSITLERATNAPVAAAPRSAQDCYTTELFCVVTAALAVAQARPKSIEVLIRGRHWRPWGLLDNAFYIAPRMEASTSTLLAGLKSLHLTLTPFPADVPHPTDTPRPFLFRKFLSLVPNLTWLRVNFTHGGRENSKDILSWLSLDPQTRGVRYPARFPHLERLDLGTVELDSLSLLNLAVKFSSTLTSLYLRRVCLYDSENYNRPKKVNPWVDCLTALSRLPGSSLRTLDLSSIRHSMSAWTGSVKFKATDTALPSPNWTCSASLVTMENAVAQAVASMSADWPPEPDPDAMDEDGSSSAEESSGEDEEEEEGEEDEGGEGDGSGEEGTGDGDVAI